MSAGDDVLSAYTSPLLVDLLDAAIRQVCTVVSLATRTLNYHDIVNALHDLPHINEV